MEVNFFAASLEKLSDWAQKNAGVAMPLPLGCCAGESALLRAGMPVCFNPRQADVLVVAGAFSFKAAPVVRRIYDMMLEPKAVVGVGNCALNGGLFADSYAVVKLADVVPVDCFVKGCPPTAADFASALARLKEKRR